MSGRICGLCGILDGASNDFTKRDGSQIDNTGSGTWPVPDIWDNVNEFGDDWCNEDLQNDPDCVEANVETEQCEEAWASYCNCEENELSYDDWIEACRFEACAASGGNLSDYSVQDGINNRFFDSSLDACQVFCSNTPREPIEVDCYVCADQCTHLTDAYGCEGNECLDTCKDCVSDIDWWDYAGRQRTLGMF